MRWRRPPGSTDERYADLSGFYARCIDQPEEALREFEARARSPSPFERRMAAYVLMVLLPRVDEAPSALVQLLRADSDEAVRMMTDVSGGIGMLYRASRQGSEANPGVQAQGEGGLQ